MLAETCSQQLLDDDDLLQLHTKNEDADGVNNNKLQQLPTAEVERVLLSGLVLRPATTPLTWPMPVCRSYSRLETTHGMSCIPPPTRRTG